MNFVINKYKFCDKIFVSLIWFIIVFIFGLLCFWIITYPYSALRKLPMTKIDYINVGFFAYFVYLIFRVFLSSFKTTFFEVKLKEENDSKGTEKYLQWYLGKKPFVEDNLRIFLNNTSNGFIINEFSYKFHFAENLVYETFSKRRFWNVFCPFIRTDELTLSELNIIIEKAKSAKPKDDII